MGQEQDRDSEAVCEIAKEGLFCRRRAAYALKGGLIGFFAGFGLFAAMQLLGLLIFHNVADYIGSLYVSLYMGIGIGVIVFIGIILFLPRLNVGNKP